jgi:hypothetical protein
MTQALVFYATGRPNEKGELNYHGYVELEQGIEQRLRQLQELVGGNIEHLPTLKNKRAPVVAFANESGLVMHRARKPGIGRNDLAGGALLNLGFATFGSPLGCAYAGNVVVMGSETKGLSDKQKMLLEQAIKKFLDDIDEDGKEEEGHDGDGDAEDDDDEEDEEEASDVGEHDPRCTCTTELLAKSGQNH